MISDRSLKIFQDTVQQVPAYKKFLSSAGFDPANVKTPDDLKSVPVISKKTYLQAYDRNELMVPSSLEAPVWMCSTSGSTGEPYYFPRGDDIAARGSWFAEAFLKYSSYGEGRTLVLMAFGMGVWIGGIVTLRSFEIAAERIKAPVAFLPTGYNKAELFKALKNLAPEFDQVILAGYPPFVKEVIDEAPNEGIDLKKLNMRLMFAAEAFTETFRTYVCKNAGVGNPLVDTLNIYGSADIGAMAYETPLSILARQIALEDPLLYRDIFGQIEKTPTLAQYHPDLIEFEEVDGELLLTSGGVLPLVRYAIGDHGGVLTYDFLEQTFKRYGIDFHDRVVKAGIADTVSRRPFVFVYERTDLSASLHGIIIYPEFVKEGLLDKRVTNYFTERFTMSTKHDIYHRQFLQINLELHPDIEPADEIERLAHDVITENMIAKSSEFSEVAKSRASEKLIQIVLWKNGHPRYFAPGTKQKWVNES